jgi:uncharacterized protein (DUF433 family)
MPADLIRSDPKIMMGKPTVGGTRITVELILEKLRRAKQWTKSCLSIPG